eukprot:PhF_6_TR38315/c0_g1_i1/m.57141
MIRTPWATAPPRLGDWLCRCNYINTAKKPHCSICTISKPMHPPRFGQWLCRMCSMYNNDDRTLCWHCEGTKVDSVGSNTNDLRKNYRILRHWQCSKLTCSHLNHPGSLRCIKCGKLKKVA